METVVLSIPIGEIEEQGESPSFSYRLDMETGRIGGMVDGMDAIRQFIAKTLYTPRFRCLIYDNQYGSELKETVITNDASPEYIAAEVPRLVKDALLADSRIFDVYGFDFEQKNDRGYISFNVSTVFGETFIEEVL